MRISVRRVRYVISSLRFCATPRRACWSQIAMRTMRLKYVQICFTDSQVRWAAKKTYYLNWCANRMHEQYSNAAAKNSFSRHPSTSTKPKLDNESILTNIFKPNNSATTRVKTWSCRRTWTEHAFNCIPCSLPTIQLLIVVGHLRVKALTRNSKAERSQEGYRCSTFRKGGEKIIKLNTSVESRKKENVSHVMNSSIEMKTNYLDAFKNQRMNMTHLQTRAKNI